MELYLFFFIVGERFAMIGDTLEFKLVSGFVSVFEFVFALVQEESGEGGIGGGGGGAVYAAHSWRVEVGRIVVQTPAELSIERTVLWLIECFLENLDERSQSNPFCLVALG